MHTASAPPESIVHTGVRTASSTARAAVFRTVTAAVMRSVLIFRVLPMLGFASPSPPAPILQVPHVLSIANVKPACVSMATAKARVEENWTVVLLSRAIPWAISLMESFTQRVVHTALWQP